MDFKISHTKISHKLMPIEIDSDNKTFIVSAKITKMTKSSMLKCLLPTCINGLLKLSRLHIYCIS